MEIIIEKIPTVFALYYALIAMISLTKIIAGLLVIAIIVVIIRMIIEDLSY